MPIWHVFLQNSFDLLNKAEYGAAIVMVMTTFDCYLDDLLVGVLSKKYGLDQEFSDKIVLSPKFGRDEFLSYWLKNLLGKSFTAECPLNEKMKEFADMRRRLVHPTSEGVDKENLTDEKAKECIDVMIKSIKWINDLKLGKS